MKKSKPNSTLVFEDPPVSGRVKTGISEKLVELATTPNKWAIIATKPYTPGSTYASTAYGIKNGIGYKTRKGDFEAVSRKVGTENYLYVRFVGKTE